MIISLISLIVIVILLLLAIKVAISKEKPEAEQDKPLIHTSGIYSIVRKSPRIEIHKFKPSEEEIRKYLSDLNVDIQNTSLSEEDRIKLFAKWTESLNGNIKEIEDGDKTGAEFYYYDFPRVCSVCKPFLTKGQFVTREEIFNFPSIIPPFHIGCTCRLKAHNGKVRETTEIGLRPLFEQGNPPQLPEWTQTVKIS